MSRHRFLLAPLHTHRKPWSRDPQDFYHGLPGSVICVLAKIAHFHPDIVAQTYEVGAAGLACPVDQPPGTLSDLPSSETCFDGSSQSRHPVVLALGGVDGPATCGGQTERLFPLALPGQKMGKKKIRLDDLQAAFRMPVDQHGSGFTQKTLGF